VSGAGPRAARGPGLPSGPWSSPDRACRTLESFARTEEDGGRDLRTAARRVRDAELRRQLEHHAADECRHADLLRRRAAELVLLHALPPPASDPRLDPSRARPGVELDAHGFYSAGLIDSLGELEYVAMVHVAETRAAALFTRCREETAHDAAMAALFDAILKDEAFHVAYTGACLEKWRAQGRAFEVERALRRARRGRRLHAWRRAGARAAAGLAHAALFVLYWTLLAPIAALSRAQRPPPGWQAPRVALPGAAELPRQY